MATLKALNFLTFPKDCLPNIVTIWPQLRLYNSFIFFSLSLSFVGTSKIIKKLAVHLHQGFQHVIHKCYDGPEGKKPVPVRAQQLGNATLLFLSWAGVAERS